MHNLGGQDVSSYGRPAYLTSVDAMVRGGFHSSCSTNLSDPWNGDSETGKGIILVEYDSNPASSQSHHGSSLQSSGQRYGASVPSSPLSRPTPSLTDTDDDTLSEDDERTTATKYMHEGRFDHGEIEAQKTVAITRADKRKLKRFR
jgi:hypothetical protein